MPVQRFASMTKDFATFDCDAHVTEPPLIWERAAEYLTREEMAGAALDHLVGRRKPPAHRQRQGRRRHRLADGAAAFPARCG